MNHSAEDAAFEKHKANLVKMPAGISRTLRPEFLGFSEQLPCRSAK